MCACDTTLGHLCPVHERRWVLEIESDGRLVLVDPDSPTPWRVWVEPTLADILSVVEANS